MQKTDRMLIGIVTGLIGLVLVAFAVLLTRPKPTYLPDVTPAASVHNYLLALQTADEARAYSYISPLAKGYPPTLEAFRASIKSNSYAFSDLNGTTLDVGQSEIAGDNATVTVSERRVNTGNVFGGNATDQVTPVSFTLWRNAAGVWQITTATGFWNYCWDYNTGC